MKVSLNWLKKYVKTSLSPNKIADGLTDLGLECTYEKTGISFTDIIVANVVECNPLKDSDHLSVCIVDVGNQERYTVVCGAPNIKSGVYVPFAKIGATLDYGQFKIKRTKIRGIESEGMICSEKELGLGKNYKGIMILDSNSQAGTSFNEIVSIEEDILYDIDLTPNRGDCLGHIGVARELALLDKNNSRIKYYQEEHLKKSDIIDGLSINIYDEDKCGRYTACIVSGVTIKESPEWLRRSLESIGQKSINNVVDAANFILMDLGHPMHTFDLDKIKSNQINIRLAKEDETINTLDGFKQKLKSDNLLICDANNPIAIAGVIGGNNSGVDKNTKNILIESAYFKPINIRKTSKDLGISTEASKRFERDTDINILVTALNKLAILIEDVAGGKISENLFDIYPQKFKLREIPFDVDKCNNFLGSDIDLDQASNIFNSLYIEYKKESRKLICTIPSFRNDLDREVDLYEEIARVLGYNNIANSKTCSMLFSSFVNDERQIDNQIRTVLSSTGFNEHYSNSLLNQSEIKIMDIDSSSVSLSNPLSKEMEFLRNSLFCGLMKAVRFNESRQEKIFKLFEIGAIHLKNKFTKTKTIEAFNVGLIWYGKEFENWSNNQKIDFHYAKGDLVQFLEQLGINEVSFKKNNNTKGFDISYDIYSLKNKLGQFGIPSKDSKAYFSIKGDLFLSELNIDLIKKSAKKKDSKISFSSYHPFISRDISILISKDIIFGDIYNLISSLDKNILKETIMFDLYEGDKIENNKKSMSFRMKFQSDDRTLKDKEVDKIMNIIINQLENKFNAIQR